MLQRNDTGSTLTVQELAETEPDVIAPTGNWLTVGHNETVDLPFYIPGLTLVGLEEFTVKTPSSKKQTTAANDGDESTVKGETK